ncbi:hypothetical protein MJO29_001072 [Puccinia striiformis f. sp. tritici]|uniref:Mid2 domain-containing protein n=1 Tax=Puccinia striiformis f. sp. tritici PST-78 TaxID=1165861 RepID=A0A0L0VM63_9BASI|nr:hypothetical protein Pst134EA_001061 [Puccinia striiformis f. sp. tritici]KAH9474006.1 hypothetical protein Pst134EA_001061 [Puccinia striiformis f. sp. tritici]KAI7967795.1 hypothetical protein MJO29_001072 [Puccinia striiformis f. sp. tritici]KAI9624963.1 hypothetical protein H4Q26_016530 [Puccinia striiformis f. sp. tritici PST-130]KNF00312.1 hypothetical protein PSTG_06485 [Puccinia striiformis f. sp. tritici PST-78]
MFFLGSRWIRDANALAALSILVIISTTLPPTNAQSPITSDGQFLPFDQSIPSIVNSQPSSYPPASTIGTGFPWGTTSTPSNTFPPPDTTSTSTTSSNFPPPFPSPGSTTSSPTFPTPDPTTSSPPSPTPSATSTQTPNQTAPATKSATSGSGFAAPESLKPEIIGGIVTGSFIGALFLIIGFLFVFTHYLRPSVPKKDKGKGVDKDNSNTTPTQPAENPRDSPC